MSETGIRLLVCGGRNYCDEETVNLVLSAFRSRCEIGMIIHGGARGADTLANKFATANNITVLCFLANWKRYSNQAGPIRNSEMIAEGKPDMILAFPGGKGTEDVIRKGLKAGIVVWRVGQDGFLKEVSLPPMQED